MKRVRNKQLLLSNIGWILVICAAIGCFSGCDEEGSDQVLPTPQPIIDGDRVLVPAGYVVLGNTPEGWGNYELEPGINPVYLDSFYIDRYEVSNQQYAAYLTTALNLSQVSVGDNDDVYDAVSDMLLIEISSEYCHITYDSFSDTFDVEDEFVDWPVVMVSWYGAYNYSTFYGERLPTESEWEKAARGNASYFGTYDGIGIGYPYPWGDARPDDILANFGHSDGAPKSIYSHLQGMSWFGAYNMAGNVREWTATSIGSAKIHRGGSFLSAPEYIRTAARAYTDPIVTDRGIGFRCVSDP